MAESGNDKIGEVEISSVTDPEQILLCYQGLEKGLISFDTKKDTFCFYGNKKKGHETSFKDSREIAGRLCSRIVALLIADSEASQSKKLSTSARYKLEFLNNRMITDYFAVSAQLKI